MRLGTLIGAALPCLALSACGADDPPQRKAPAPVRLQISSPSDTATVNGATVEVRGSVIPPGARVRVLGRVARVSGGSFSAVVDLEQGSNVIDVAASARGRTAAFAAVRIAREDLVTVPVLVGVAADEAEDELHGLGLQVEASRGGGLIDRLLPGDVAVCEQDPEPGGEVRRGSTVRLLVARAC